MKDIKEILSQYARKWNFKQKQQTKMKLMKMCAAKQNKLSFFRNDKIFDRGLICLLQKKIVLSEKDFYLWGEAFWRFSFLLTGIVLFVNFACPCSQFFLLDLLTSVHSTFCQICLFWGNAPYLLPDRALALAICWWASAHPLFVTRAAGPFICYYIYYIIALFVRFPCLCSQHFLLDLLRLCSQHFLLILISLFIALFVRFTCVCSQHFLRVFFVILYNKKKGSF